MAKAANNLTNESRTKLFKGIPIMTSHYWRNGDRGFCDIRLSAWNAEGQKNLQICVTAIMNNPLAAKLYQNAFFLV